MPPHACSVAKSATMSCSLAFMYTIDRQVLDEKPLRMVSGFSLFITVKKVTHDSPS
ncbi:hypothetical protein C8J48_1207 [Desmospora activa DSM 45169]|uniref:Uncharacterized protein n=1 Tax=Desmospora activa DSM 45169 TaxID=1121389 RepID=A0A2T4Z9Q5_9BACL|nr:hypothetical protein C8J48_1207 [Desmospora activa DSM 45169]